MTNKTLLKLYQIVLDGVPKLIEPSNIPDVIEAKIKDSKPFKMEKQEARVSNRLKYSGKATTVDSREVLEVTVFYSESGTLQEVMKKLRYVANEATE